MHDNIHPKNEVGVSISFYFSLIVVCSPEMCTLLN